MRKSPAKSPSQTAKDSIGKLTLPSPARKAKPAPSSMSFEASSQWPPQVVESLTQASQAGTWLIAVFSIQNNRMQLERTAHNFPLADLDLACRLFVENLQELKR